MKRTMRKPHNHKKTLINYIGFSAYEDANYKNHNVLSTLRAFTLILIPTFICMVYGNYNVKQDLLNPLISINEIEVQAQEPTPTPEPDKCSLIENEIEQYICEVFEEDYEDAMTILSCENKGLNPLAINDANSNGSIDVGIFQINSIHGFTVEEMQDWKANVDFAHKLFERGGWYQWSCSYTLGITPFYER